MAKRRCSFKFRPVEGCAVEEGVGAASKSPEAGPPAIPSATSFASSPSPSPGFPGPPARARGPRGDCLGELAAPGGRRPPDPLPFQASYTRRYASGSGVRRKKTVRGRFYDLSRRRLERPHSSLRSDLLRSGMVLLSSSLSCASPRTAFTPTLRPLAAFRAHSRMQRDAVEARSRRAAGSRIGALPQADWAARIAASLDTASSATAGLPKTDGSDLDSYQYPVLAQNLDAVFVYGNRAALDRFETNLEQLCNTLGERSADAEFRVRVWARRARRRLKAGRSADAPNACPCLASALFVDLFGAAFAGQWSPPASPSSRFPLPWSAPQASRAAMLEKIPDQGLYENYSGWRRTFKGKAFHIDSATLFRVKDEEGETVGTAAVLYACHEEN